MVGRGHMASAGARAYNGVWGGAPSWVQVAEPRWVAGQGRNPLKLKAFEHLGVTPFGSLIIICHQNSENESTKYSHIVTKLAQQ